MIDAATLPVAVDSSIELAGCQRNSNAHNKKTFDVLVEGLTCPVKNSRGDCPSFEPWIAAIVEAALSPTAETIVAAGVLRLSA